MDRLKANPEERLANGVLGRYWCFVQEDWSKGLTALANGDQRQTAAAAISEVQALAADSPDPKALFDAAGKWWTVADGGEVSADAKAAIRRHAADLYRAVQTRLADPLDSQLARKRISDAVSVPEQGPGVLKQAETTRLVGGDGGVEFTDDPPRLATVAGFVVRYGNLVDSIQVVYRLPDGSLQSAVAHGGEGGVAETFELMAGEEFVGISGKAGRHLGAVRFHTNRRVSKLYGMGPPPHQTPFELALPSGAEFIGFAGRSGLQIDAIALRYRQRK
jgi:hypothetical protein